MPSRIGDIASRVAADGRVTRSEIDLIQKQVNVDGVLSGREKKELTTWFNKNADKFDTDARAAMTKLLGLTPPSPAPVTPTPAPVIPAPAPVTPEPVKPAVRPDIADPTVLKKHEGSLSYGRIEGGKLFVDGVSYDDVVQGSIGDCYMVAAFSAVAKSDPKAIEDAIKDNGDGTYTVRFFEKSSYGNPKSVSITIDDDLPTNGTQSPRYAKGRDTKELWVPLLEKAYAQWKGGYEQVGNGGVTGDVITALTGKSASYTSVKTASSDRLFEQIKTGAGANRAMAAGTYGEKDNVDYTGTGVYAWHAYTLLGAFEENGNKYVQLRNPWGSSEHNSDGISDGKNDGIFKMKMEDFTKLYSGVTISY